LHFTKQFTNWIFRLLDKLLKFKESTYPQTKMLQNSFDRALGVYRLQVKDGIFDVPDGNFERFLRVGYKLISSIAEEDRFYRAWLGLAYLIAERELSEFMLSPQEIKYWIKRQWLDDIDFLPDAVVWVDRVDFRNIVLSNSFSNLLDIEE
jgi:hypothetical protein